MSDRDIMEGLLLTAKNAVDLYMHGSVESATPEVNDAFNAALTDTLAMQSCIFNQMSQHGWYTTQQAQAQQLQQVKQKYSSPCC